MANYFRFFLLVIAMTLALGQVSASARRTSSNRPTRGQTGHVARDTTVDTSSYPYLIADEFAMVENDPQECFVVLMNDRNHNLNAASLAIYSYPEHGSATVTGSTICFRPQLNFNGWELFSYSVCTIDGLCDWAEIRIYVAPVDQAPVAVGDMASVGEDDLYVTIDVLANDYDVDGPYTNYDAFTIVSPPQFGVVRINEDHTVTYYPTFEGFNRQIGIDTFVYQICDTDVAGLCAFGTVGVTVEDACSLCESCQSKLTSFNDHASTLRTIYHTDVFDPITALSS